MKKGVKVDLRTFMLAEKSNPPSASSESSESECFNWRHVGQLFTPRSAILKLDPMGAWTPYQPIWVYPAQTMLEVVASHISMHPVRVIIGLPRHQITVTTGTDRDDNHILVYEYARCERVPPHAEFEYEVRYGAYVSVGPSLITAMARLAHNHDVELLCQTFPDFENNPHMENIKNRTADTVVSFQSLIYQAGPPEVQPAEDEPVEEWPTLQ